MIRLIADLQRRLLEWRFFRFGVAGGVGFVVDAAVLTALVELAGMNPYVARIFSFYIAATSTWLVNRHYTFGDRPSGRSLFGEWLHYLSMMMVGGATNYAIYALSLSVSATVREYPALGVLIGTSVSMFVNFNTSKHLIFKGS